MTKPNTPPPDERVRVALTGLRWGEHERGGQFHTEWFAPCGCAYHPQPFPHVHPCSEAHKRPDLHAPAHPGAGEPRDAVGRALRWFEERAPSAWHDYEKHGAALAAEVRRLWAELSRRSTAAKEADATIGRAEFCLVEYMVDCEGRAQYALKEMAAARVLLSALPDAPTEKDSGDR